MTEQTWQAFVKWCAEQERVTFYKDQDELQWYIEWFNRKGGFKSDCDHDLTTVIERVTGK